MWLNIRSILSDKIAATITNFKQSQKVSIEEKLIDGKLSLEFSAEKIRLVINNIIISVNAQDDYILTRSLSEKDEIINKIRTLRYEVEESSNKTEENRKTHFYYKGWNIFLHLHQILMPIPNSVSWKVG